MTTGAIIFSRFDSRRLPGKALIDVGGMPLLHRVIDRAQRIPGAPPVAVATTTRPEDDTVAALATALGVAVFRGALDDVAGRGLACARQFAFRRFVRICGDRPFFDPGQVAALIALAEDGDRDLATNVQRKTYPAGLTAEVVRTEALACALAASEDPEDREHVTRYFYRHPEAFSIVNIAADEDWTDVSLVVDTPEDLDRARFIARRLAPDDRTAGAAAVVAAARAWYQALRPPAG